MPVPVGRFGRKHATTAALGMPGETIAKMVKECGGTLETQ
jgi:hypothetical protein